MGGYIKSNGGRLLVMAAFLILLTFAHHSSGNPNEHEFSAFCQAKAGEAFSAFLALITGHLLAGGNGDTKKKDAVPDPNQLPSGQQPKGDL